MACSPDEMKHPPPDLAPGNVSIESWCGFWGVTVWGSQWNPLGMLPASTLEQRPLLLPRTPWAGEAADDTMLRLLRTEAPGSYTLAGCASRGFPAGAPGSSPRGSQNGAPFWTPASYSPKPETTWSHDNRNEGGRRIQVANQRLRWEMILDYLGGANVIRRILQSGGRGQESQCCRGCDGGRDHEPRNAGGLKEGKAGSGFSPGTSGKTQRCVLDYSPVKPTVDP